MTRETLRRSSRRPNWLALGLLLLAAGLRFWRLGAASFWYDEAYSWYVGAEVTPAASLASSLTEFIPPGTYVLWRAWAALTGTSEFALRAMSALAGVVGVAAAGRTAVRLVGRTAVRLVGRTGTRQKTGHSAGQKTGHRPVSTGEGTAQKTGHRPVSTGEEDAKALVTHHSPLTTNHSPLTTTLLLAALAPPLLWASREMRMYGPLLAFTMLGNAALLEALLGRNGARRAWAWLWGAMALAALYSVVLSGFWLVGQGVFFLAVLALEPDGPDRAARRWAHVRALAPPALVAAALYLPWLIPALRHLGENRGYWAGTLPLPAFFARTVQGITVFRSVMPEVEAQRLGALITAFSVVAPVLSMPVLVSDEMRQAWLLGGPAVLRTPVEFLLGPGSRFDPRGLWRRPFPRHLMPALFILSLMLPPLLLMGLAVRALPKWDLQHTVIFAPPVYVVLGVVGARMVESRKSKVEGWERQPGGLLQAGAHVAVLWLLRLALVLVVMALATSSWNLLSHPALANDDWRGLTAHIRANAAPDEVVIIRAGCALPTWRYYEQREGSTGCARVVPLPDDPLLDVTHVLDYATAAPTLSSRLRGATGAWVVGYLQNVADPTDIVGALLEDIGAEQPVPAFHGLELRHYTFDDARLPASFGYPALPATTHSPGVEPLPGLRLWGATLPSAPVPADDLVRVRTWWTTDDPAAHEGRVYQASLRVTDAAGNVWGQEDAPPGGGDYRPERWPASTPDDPHVVLGTLDVALLPGTPTGTYTATLILYEVGGSARSDPFLLGSLAVGRSETPPEVPETFLAPTRVEGDAALSLMGIRVDRTTVEPCETLVGALFWEVTAPLRLPYRIRIGLGLEQMLATPTNGESLEGAPEFRPGDRFQTQFRLPIDCRALDTEAPLEVALVMPGATHADPYEVLAAWQGPEARIVADRRFALPAVGLTGAPVTPLSVVFGTRDEAGALTLVTTLVGMSVAAESEAGPPARLVVPADKPFVLVLYWRADVQTDIPYTVFVHATPPESEGPVAAQHDGWPGLGERPTPHWVSGEVVADPHPVPALPAGTYALRVGLYGPDGVRLAAEDGDVAVVALVTVR